MMALARTVMLVVVLGATRTYAADIDYLAPPGVPAKEFPSLLRNSLVILPAKKLLGPWSMIQSP